jgi:hypothetical protein
VKPGAVKLLIKAKECAIEAGVYDKMFLSFGTLLGAIRPTKDENHKYRLGLMEHDDDMDIGWLPMSEDKKKAYFESCIKHGLFNWGLSNRHSVMTNGDIMWFSIKDGENVRSCNWFFFEWDNFMWHSKGGLWLNEIKFPSNIFPRSEDAQGVMLGAPAEHFKQLTEIDFEGEKFNVPLNAGSLCDFWYPGWAVPRNGGASSKHCCGIINDWEDKNTWKIISR